jgi:FkbM family methyltransferase
LLLDEDEIIPAGSSADGAAEMKWADHALRWLLHRKRFFKLNELFFKFGLRGIGVLNYENDRVSGERRLIGKVVPRAKTVFDVGANEGRYSVAARRCNPHAEVYAFEPNPSTYNRLRKIGEQHLFHTFKYGLGAHTETLPLFDYKGSTGSEHATLYQEVMEQIHRKEAVAHTVDIRTIDETVKQLEVDTIDLLKIDAEGHEYEVLLGAEGMLRSGNILVIHFEFNEMAVVSRHYLRDFMLLLKEYDLFRLLPDGAVPLSSGSYKFIEILAYQNIVAIRKNQASNFTV